MSTMPLNRPSIPAILVQHLEEAAFCWLRRQQGLWSPAFRAEHVRRFDLLLDAHLEGLRVAGAATLAPALAAFAKWKTPDEAFVSTYVLVHNPDPTLQADLEALILDNPEAAPGATAALLWSTPEAASALVRAWETHAEGFFRRIALPAALRASQDRAFLASRATQDPATRARALRALGECRAQDLALQQGLTDADPDVRLEAILALAILGDPGPAANLPELFSTLRPSALKRALIAWGTLASDDAFQRWMADPDPATLRLRFWAVAFRGDAAWDDFLADHLADPATAQLAAYALGHITGMDVDLEGLDGRADGEDSDATVPAEDSEEKENPDDIGLLQPDPEKVREWLKQHAFRFPAGSRFLAGASLDEAAKLLATGTQPQRWQAAFLLAQKGQPEALRDLRNPSLQPYLPKPLDLTPPPMEDWKVAMMRGIEEERRETARKMG